MFTSKKPPSRTAAAAVAITATALLAACSAQAPTGQPVSAGAGETSCDAEVTIANLPVGSATAIVLGVQEGFFEEEGLDVTLKDTAAPALQASVVSGEAQFGFTSIPAILATTSNSLPVKVIAPAAGFPNDGEPANIVAVAAADSGITSAEDLQGKTVGVDALFQLPHIGLLRALEAHGLDPSGIEVSEIAYPAMIEAVQRGQVDAVVLSDGFLLEVLEAGLAEVLPLNTGVEDGENQTIWFSSDSYIEQNPDVVACFQRAVAASNAFAAENPDAVRAALPTFTKFSADVAAVLRLPNFDVTLNHVPFTAYAQIMAENGVIENAPDIEAIIVD